MDAEGKAVRCQDSLGVPLENERMRGFSKLVRPLEMRQDCCKPDLCKGLELNQGKSYSQITFSPALQNANRTMRRGL